MEIRQGYKQTEVGIIPEEWEVKTLGECFEVIMGQSPSSESYNEKEDGLPLVQGNADIKNNKVYPRMYTSEITKESYPNDLIMTVRAPVGDVYISDIHSCIGRGICAIRNGNRYLYYYLFNYKDKWERLAQGSTFTAITVKDVKELSIPIPPLKEQEKIAEILSNYDKTMEQQELLIEKEKEFKKGMMQKIFSQEIRFKDDNREDYPEWEEKRLQEIFTEKIERNIEKKELELLSVSINDGVQKRSEIEAKDNSSEDKSKYKIVRKDNIVYNTMRMWQGALGVSQYCGIVSPAYTVISLKVEGDINYFKYLFKTSNMIFLFKKFSQGLTSDTWNLKFEKFKEIKVLLPSSLEEQNKIVELLSLIDSKIELLEKKLELLKKEKKGIMQKLLTGEVRV